MNFLTLTSYIGDPVGYADCPDFRRQVWPLLIRRRDEIEAIFLFRHDNGASTLTWSKPYQPATPNVILIESMGQLGDEALSQLAHWSFYGGHLNVLYQVSSQSGLFLDLYGLYPSARLSSDDLDSLGLEEVALSELRSFLDTLSERSVMLSFAHDADPLYLFGDPETLGFLLRQNPDPRSVT